MNENAAYIFDVEAPRQWTFTSGKTWVAGWFVSKTGAVFRDLRAWVDDRPFTGIFGLPRPEIEAKYRSYAGLPYAGFSFLIEPHPGAKLLRLELLDQGNNWVEFWRQPIKVKSGAASARPKLDPRLVPGVISRLLKTQRAKPDIVPAELTALARTLALEAATEQLVVQPSPPFWGALETPSLGGHSQYGKLPVTGWLIHLEQRIVRLTASADPMMENAVELGRGREDAVRMFPQHAAAATSGFFGMADIIEHRPDPAWLKVFAELEDGSRHLVFVRPFHQLNCNQKEQPYPEFRSGYFWTAARALWRACREQHIRTGGPRELIPALREAYRHFTEHAPASLAHLALEQEPPYRQWLRHNRLSPALTEIMRTQAAVLAAGGPVFRLLADARGCTAAHLGELAATLQAQLYPRWELHFILPHDTPLAGTAAALATDARIAFHQAADRAGFAGALNAALQSGQAGHVTLLPAHSRLSPDALLQLAEKLTAQPGLELVYTDEDCMDDTGVRSAPGFKSDWSPALALSGLFPGHLSVMSRARLDALGGFREAYSLVPWYDVLLRLTENLPADRVAHVPHVCHHARAGVPLITDLADPSIEQARAALQDSLQRRGSPAAAFFPETAHHQRRRYHQLCWPADVLVRLPVTIVIPTRDRLHLLQECFELLNETVNWSHVRLIIVDDHSRDPDALRFLDMIQRRPGLRCKVLRPDNPQAPFNYSHLVNLALPHVETPLILHLNNDVNALEPGWLEEMAGWFTQPDVGVVGAQLIYPDRSLNHTGIVVGPHGGLADTPLAKMQPRELPEIEWHAATREVSAVTGACLLTRTELYRRLNGFDEPALGVAFNDVDYCLRAQAAGYRVLYTPQAKLMHWGSATRGVTFDEAEHIAFIRRYPGFRDPYLNPSLTLTAGRPAPAHTRYVHAARGGRLRVLLLTHNFNLEGAPLFLIEYATYLVREAGFSLEVFTTEDGPLRARYEALGAKITLGDRHRIYSAANPEEFTSRVDEVRARFDFRAIDLVVCNTLVCFWGVHLAHRAGKPSLFYIHESSSIFRFFEKALPLPMHALVGGAFRLATRALFLCRATERYYKEFDERGNFRRIPSWIQIEAIADFQRAHPRAELRRRLGYSEDETIVANIGTVCERKGQHTFIRAVAHFNRQHAGAGRHRFLLVGGRAGVYLDLLREEIKRLGIANLEIIMETREAYQYFQAADLFVCSSYEESFPRVLLEAMAFRTPIVSTDVHGIPEMVGQRQDAYLVPPGDELALSRMMKTCLDKERSGKTLTATAYSTVLRYYDYHRVLPRHVDLAREACLDFDAPAGASHPL
jgi:glycosyltransferase involved in cell wall biosynthesis